MSDHVDNRLPLTPADQKIPLDYSAMGNDVFFTQHFQPVYAVVKAKKREQAAVFFEFSKAERIFNKANTTLTEIRDEVRLSPAMDGLKSASEAAEKEYKEAGSMYESHWREKGPESWEEFLARRETDQTVKDAYVLREEKKRLKDAASERLEYAIDETPQVTEVRKTVEAAEKRYKELEDQKNQLKAHLREIESEYGWVFFQRGYKLLEEKQKELLDQLTKEWQGRPTDKYGFVYENVSFDQPVSISSPTGEIYLAIDVGDPARMPIEDRVLVIPKTEGGSTYLVDADGLGGYDSGNVAAECLVRTIQKDAGINASGETMQKNASDQMSDVGLEDAGVCYASLKITGNKMDVARAGDVRVVVIRNKDLVYATEDEGFLNVVDNAVTGSYHGDTTTDSFELQKDDIVVLASDGITDNFYPNHYNVVAEKHWDYDVKDEARLSNGGIVKIINEHEDLAEAIKEIGKYTLEEMNGQGKKDHRSLIIYRHQKK